MSLATNPEGSAAMARAIRDSQGLFAPLNKAKGNLPGDQDVYEDEYTSSLDDEKISALAKAWILDYASYYGEIEKTQKRAFEYWIGKQIQLGNEVSGVNPVNTNNVDNLIFESLETFLPIATAANPQAVVSADPSPQGQNISKVLTAALAKEADKQKLRRKLAKLTRQWALFRIGGIKNGFDVVTGQISCEVIPSKRFIFDKDGFVDEGGIFQGDYIGERKKVDASTLIKLFPKKEELVRTYVKHKMGTKVRFIEWWYKNDDVFYTMDTEAHEVLGKFKNPNWNYDIKKRDEAGKMTSETERHGTNFIEQRRNPYVFLSIFSIGDQPHDNTSLIEQNIGKQNVVNKRWKQIDKNADSMNNGLVVSDVFTSDQAAGAAAALRRGESIRVPGQDVQKHVWKMPTPGLPEDVYINLRDAREEIRNSFGTSGSTPQGQSKEDTVRGKILVAQQDSSRIGGTITSQIEQVANSIYQYWVQLMFVYYDEEHFILSSGLTGGMELLSLKNDSFPFIDSLEVTVKEGSLIPKDPLTERNEAIDLWSANAIDPLNFFNKLGFSDPAATTQALILWQMWQKGQIEATQYLPSFKLPEPSQSIPLQREKVEEPVGQPPHTGVGGPAVNPLGPVNGAENETLPAGSPEATQIQAKQLLESIPIR